jgi:hypothetical protein
MTLNRFSGKIFLVLLGFFACPLWAEPAPHSFAWFSHFQVNGFMGFQPGNGYSFAPEVSWNPTFQLSPLVSLRGNIGLTALRNTNDSSQVFLVSEYEAFAAFFVDDGYLGLGGGAQSWTDSNGGINPLLALDIGWPLPKPFLGVLERLFLGYQLYFSSPRVTHEFKLGIGVAF